MRKYVYGEHSLYERAQYRRHDYVVGSSRWHDDIVSMTCSRHVNVTAQQ